MKKQENWSILCFILTFFEFDLIIKLIPRKITLNKEFVSGKATLWLKKSIFMRKIELICQDLIFKNDTSKKNKNSTIILKKFELKKNMYPNNWTK